MQPINLGKTIIHTVEELSSYIESDAGWYENLVEDWKHVMNKVGLEGINLTHVNASGNQGSGSLVEEYYTDKEKEIVQKIYKKDFEKFRYDF